jgi:hypothetical protein
VPPPVTGGVDEPDEVCEEPGDEEEPPPQEAMKAMRIKAAMTIES